MVKNIIFLVSPPAKMIGKSVKDSYFIIFSCELKILIFLFPSNWDNDHHILIDLISLQYDSSLKSEDEDDDDDDE